MENTIKAYQSWQDSPTRHEMEACGNPWRGPVSQAEAARILADVAYAVDDTMWWRDPFYGGEPYVAARAALAESLAAFVADGDGGRA